MNLTLERIKELDAQVWGIAAHLGWEFDPKYAVRQEQGWNYHAQIKSGNKRISFSSGNYKQEGRFIVRGVFPRDKRGHIQTAGYGVKYPEITVAIDRGPEKIARVIQSRLLPEYEKQLAIALDHVEKSDAYHAGRLQTLKVIAEYFGQPIPEDDDKPIYIGHLQTDLGINKIEIVSEGVKFDVTCGVPEAIKIFEIIKGE